LKVPLLSEIGATSRGQVGVIPPELPQDPQAPDESESLREGSGYVFIIAVPIKEEPHPEEPSPLDHFCSDIAIAASPVPQDAYPKESHPLGKTLGVIPIIAGQIVENADPELGRPLGHPPWSEVEIIPSKVHHHRDPVLGPTRPILVNIITTQIEDHGRIFGVHIPPQAAHHDPTPWTLPVQKELAVFCRAALGEWAEQGHRTINSLGEEKSPLEDLLPSDALTQGEAPGCPELIPIWCLPALLDKRNVKQGEALGEEPPLVRRELSEGLGEDFQGFRNPREEYVQRPSEICGHTVRQGNPEGLDPRPGGFFDAPKGHQKLKASCEGSGSLGEGFGDRIEEDYSPKGLSQEGFNDTGSPWIRWIKDRRNREICPGEMGDREEMLKGGEGRSISRQG
jgi:hypothetical protein